MRGTTRAAGRGRPREEKDLPPPREGPSEDLDLDRLGRGLLSLAHGNRQDAAVVDGQIHDLSSTGKTLPVTAMGLDITLHESGVNVRAGSKETIRSVGAIKRRDQPHFIRGRGVGSFPAIEHTGKRRPRGSSIGSRPSWQAGTERRQS